MAVDWRVYLPGRDEYATNLLDVHMVDAYNRFARKADILLDDPAGTDIHTYTRGTPVELEVDPSGQGDWFTRFGGFVIDPQTTEHETEVELYSHDFWLRKRNVISNYSQTTIREMIHDLVTRLTPLRWNADLVDVTYNETVDANWQGQQLDQVIDELSTWSNGEVFGATRDMEFFFREPELGSSPRTFLAGDYVDAAFEEDGTKEINQVTVYYADGNKSVTVDDRESQEALADQIGASTDRVILDVTKSYPEITTEANARKKAEDILTGRTTIRTGTIETWEAFGVEPGHEARVVVPEQDVDTELRVAEIEYYWLEDTTEIAFADVGDGVVDTLVGMSDELERIESRGANPDASRTVYDTHTVPFMWEIDIAAYTRSVPDDMFVLGDSKGNLGHEDVGGGFLGDQTGEKTKVFEDAI